MNKRQRKKKRKKESTYTLGGITYTFSADLSDDDGNIMIGDDASETLKACAELDKVILDVWIKGLDKGAIISSSKSSSEEMPRMDIPGYEFSHVETSPEGDLFIYRPA